MLRRAYLRMTEVHRRRPPTDWNTCTVCWCGRAATLCRVLLAAVWFAARSRAPFHCLPQLSNRIDSGRHSWRRILGKCRKGTKKCPQQGARPYILPKTWRLGLMKINSKSTSETIRASCPSPRPGGYCFRLRSSFEEEKPNRPCLRHRNPQMNPKPEREQRTPPVSKESLSLFSLCYLLLEKGAEETA